MTPREIIAKHLCAMAAHDWDKLTPFQRAAFRTTAGGIIEDLNSADYIHAPTVEKCARVVEQTKDGCVDEFYIHDCDEHATAIRALAKEKQG